MRRPTVFLALASLALGATGCSTPAPTASDRPPDFEVVVLGDSLSVEPPHDCDGCITYMDTFSADLSTRLGTGVQLKIDAVQDTGIADTLAAATGSSVDDLESADLVLVWIGTNDGPPWPDASPCGPVPTEQVDELLAGVEAYSQECIDNTIAEYGAQYADLFAAVTAASPGAQHLALTTYDNWFHHPFLDDSTFEQSRVDAIVEKIAGTFDDWNVAQCAAAEENGFECVDTYHLVNGADGRQPGGILFAPDGTHLSQGGHDAVADLLASVVVTGG